MFQLCDSKIEGILTGFLICFNSFINWIGTVDTSTQVKLEGDVNQGVAYYKKALYHNWHYADAMYNLGVAYGEMLKFDMVCDSELIYWSIFILFRVKIYWLGFSVFLKN